MPKTFTFGEFLGARSVIGTTLAELGHEHPNLWVLTPDIGATVIEFRDTFPDRFIDVGLAEQVCVGIAAGLAYDGNIPVVSGMLPFLSMRALEQIRTDVCYPNLPVKIIGTHGGLVGNGGSTHYAVEDLALMCALTNMTVTSVGDPLMDLGGTLAYWVQDDDDEFFRQFRRQPTHLPGMLSRDEVVRHYCDAMGYRVTPEQWRFYEVFGAFRLAVIAQQIYYRFHHGQTSNPAYGEFADVVRLLDHRCAALVGAPS